MESRFSWTHSIDDLFHNLTWSKICDGWDTKINHELIIGISKTKTFNEIVQGNIFTLQQSASSFWNLLTQQNFPTDVSQMNLNCLSDDTEKDKVFHREQFIEKSKKVSKVIHKVKLPAVTDKFIITDITCKTSKKKEKNCPKEIAAFQRKIDIAKGKGGKLHNVLKYDVTESNMLYDDDIMTKHKKSKFIGEIQNFLPEQSVLHDLGGTKMDNTCIMDSFWESDSNKRKLTDCASEYYLEHPMKAELTIVCSGYLILKDTWENRPAKSSGNVLVALRFSHHHFNRKRKQIWG